MTTAIVTIFILGLFCYLAWEGIKAFGALAIVVLVALYLMHFFGAN
jgi:hypothetical protein